MEQPPPPVMQRRLNETEKIDIMLNKYSVTCERREQTKDNSSLQGNTIKLQAVYLSLQRWGSPDFLQLLRLSKWAGLSLSFSKL